MPSSTAQVQESAACQNNHTMPIRENEAVHLRLDVLNLDAREALEACHVDLVVEVANVAHDGIVLHLRHVVHRDDVEVACARAVNVDLANHFLHGHHLESFHACLEGTNRVALSDQHTGTCTAHGEGTALAHIAVAANQCT